MCLVFLNKFNNFTYPNYLVLVHSKALNGSVLITNMQLIVNVSLPLCQLRQHKEKWCLCCAVYCRVVPRPWHGAKKKVNCFYSDGKIPGIKYGRLEFSLWFSALNRESMCRYWGLSLLLTGSHLHKRRELRCLWKNCLCQALMRWCSESPFEFLHSMFAY